MKETLVVNLFGGPGTGKSTIAAAVFAELKMKNIDCELVTEYAKTLVWEGRKNVLMEDQLYIFAKQNRYVKRVYGQVDVIVTDCPIILSKFYNTKYGDEKSLNVELLNDLVQNTYDMYNNLNIFLTRVKKYNPNGRLQTEDGAKEIDVELYHFLYKNEVICTTYNGCKKSVEPITGLIESIIRGIK